jgi:hypothetical protein
MDIKCNNPRCGKVFHHDRTRERKYCSRACYHATAHTKNAVVDRQGPHKNSILNKVRQGDKALLSKLGLTRDQAMRKYRYWVKDGNINYMAMERWYRNEIRVKGTAVAEGV